MATTQIPEKPAYRAPTMADIAAAESNGLVVASTFSGGGGSCTGYELAGYRVAWANEFEPTAADTYAENHSNTILDRRDIRTIHGAEIREAVGCEVDLFDGSPPCQSFSMAGTRSSGWGKEIAHADGTTQRSDDLFFEYARLLGELMPRAFIAENVAGLVAGAAKGYFLRIIDALRAPGYRVAAQVLDAQWLGVPQHRKRVIIIGLRDDLELDPVFPDPLPYRYSFRDACPWIGGDERLVVRQGGWKDREPGDLDKPAPTLLTGQTDWSIDRGQELVWQGGMAFNRGHRQSVDRLAPTVTSLGIGGNLKREVTLRTQYGPKHVKHRDVDEPAPTVMAAGINSVRQGQASVPGDGAATDPDTGESLSADGVGPGRRRLMIAEVKRLCSFPDDYVLHGSYNQQWARLGNSVPPLMMRAIAARLAPVLTSGS